MKPRHIPHVRFTLSVAATIAAVTLLCATDTAEPRATAIATLAPLMPDTPDVPDLTAQDDEEIAGDQDLALVQRQKGDYAQVLRSRIDALGNTAFTVNADDPASDDFALWRDLKARQEHFEAELASLRAVTPDEWPLLRENLDDELGGSARGSRRAARTPAVVPR